MRYAYKYTHTRSITPSISSDFLPTLSPSLPLRLRSGNHIHLGHWRGFRRDGILGKAMITIIKCGTFLGDSFVESLIGGGDVSDVQVIHCYA